MKSTAEDKGDVPDFVCTKCKLQFAGDNRMSATCPECGEVYGHFHTQLIRCGTFAFAYWADDYGGEIRHYKAE